MANVTELRLSLRYAEARLAQLGENIADYLENVGRWVEEEERLMVEVDELKQRIVETEAVRTRKG